jgi:hypothetical protein
MYPCRFKASLRFFSQTIDPSEICDQLSLKAEWKQKKGELRTNPKGIALGGVYDISYCSFLIQPKKNEELHEVLDRIADELLKHEPLFRQIRDGGGSIEFFIGWYSTGNTGDTFSSALLEKLGALQIDLALDVYGETKEIL